MVSFQKFGSSFWRILSDCLTVPRVSTLIIRCNETESEEKRQVFWRNKFGFMAFCFSSDLQRESDQSFQQYTLIELCPLSV